MLRMLRKKMKVIIIFVAVLFAASIFSGIGYQALSGRGQSTDDNSIAKVNGKEIDQARLIQTINNLYSQQGSRVKPQDVMILQTIALNQVIDFTVILDQAKKNVRVSRKEIDGALAQVMQANKISDMNQLKASVERSGIGFNNFKRLIKDDISVSKMSKKVRDEVAIGPDDLREIKTRHILIRPKYVYIEDEKKREAENSKADLEARLKAEELLKKLKEGQDFSTLAGLYSDDIGNRDKGGDLGYITTDMMVPEFESAAFKLKPGEVSDIVKTRFGFHLVKVEDTRLRIVSTVEGKDISEIVLNEKKENAFRKWLSEAKNKADVEISNETLKAYNLALSGKLKEGISLLQGLVARNSFDPYNHFLLAELYTQNGKLELAIFEYKKAAEMGSSSPDYLISLGNAYLSAKKAGIKAAEGESFDKLALEQFRKASLIAGDNKVMHEELKEIFKTSGYSSDVKKEEKEISRIEKKEKFEQDIKARATLEAAPETWN